MSFHHPIPPMPRNALNDPYAASCNPPRQVKRLRPDSVTTVQPIAMAPKKPSAPSESDAPQNRRGRKPNTSSRAAREAQRKMNHSIIEKARRTKINDALATLRTLVPPHIQRSQNQEGDVNEDELQEDEKGKKPGEEKEFKLDILVRTVTFLQDLTERVKDLEQRECSKCGVSAPSTSQMGDKRKRDLVEEEDEESLHRTQTQTQTSDPSVPTSSTSFRLPSIASWLPSSIDATQSLLPSPRMTQDKESIRLSTSPRQSHLPSPPNSTRMRPSITTQVPAVLVLPSPSAGTVPTSSNHRESFSRTPTVGPSSVLVSPVISPRVRSADDESAASTLLNISSLSYRPLPPPKDKERDRKASDAHTPVQPSTPSSLLGIER